MKKCTWCGMEYSEDRDRCPIDNEPLATTSPPEHSEDNPFFNTRVGINGWIQSKTSRNNKKVVYGRTWELKDSYAQMVLCRNHFVLKTLGGPYIIKLKSVTKMEKQFLLWDLHWDDPSSIGNLTIGGWGFETFVEYIRERMHNATQASPES